MQKSDLDILANNFFISPFLCSLHDLSSLDGSAGIHTKILFFFFFALSPKPVLPVMESDISSSCHGEHAFPDGDSAEDTQHLKRTAILMSVLFLSNLGEFSVTTGTSRLPKP